MHHLQNIVETLIDLIFWIIPRKKVKTSPLIVAHRGWHQDGTIENTLHAFQKAYDAGLWGIEFDIRWTRDLVPVVHHDKDLKRVWGKNLNIADLDFKELRALVPDIPALEEVIKKFGKKIHFFIELKAEKLIDLTEQSNILRNLLSTLAPVEDFHLMALDYDLFRKFHLYDNKDVYVLVSIINPLKIMKQALNNPCGAVTGHYLLISKKIQKRLSSENISVGTGFIKSKNSLYRELRRGSHWIFTNHPQNLIS